MRNFFRTGTIKILSIFLLLSILIGTTPQALAASSAQTEPPPNPTSIEPTIPTYPGPPIADNPVILPIIDDPLAPGLSIGFEGPNYNTNIANTSGYAFIPPDPIAAAGPNHVVAVVNVSIEWHSKAGTLENSQSLQSFFTGTSRCATALSPAPATFTFDPKVIYDQYENRFVIVTLERVTSVPYASRIYLAVSDDNDPNGTWYCAVVDLKTNIGGTDTWADYPGFAVDEEAIYITNNMFSFAGSYSGVRLWIVDKGIASGFYNGGTISQNIIDPYASWPTWATTSQPTHIFNFPTPLPASVGTFLVSYSGISNGVTKSIQVLQVNNPLTTPSFTRNLINVGDIDNTAAGMPDAPQNGSVYAIETNDRRALHAVWRDNSLFITTTVVPGTGVDAGEATAHWFEINPFTFTVINQGNIGGEDIAPDTYTFFPSVAVDQCGNVGFGFAASAATIYAGSYYTNRYASDAGGTVQSSGTNQAGLAPYHRDFSSGRNRWGDYSGIALDPENQSTFWVFNEYALTGTGGANDGTWATKYGAFPSGLDYGDLPSSYNNTIFGDDGARHCLGDVYLGTDIGPKTNGQENANAAADSDDDGVDRDMDDPWLNNQSVDILFDLTNVSGNVDIGLWIDWNGDGSFTAGTDYFSFSPVPGGSVQTRSIAIPGSGVYTVGNTIFARIRVFEAGGAPGGALDSGDSVGMSTNGEVEDYQWRFEPTTIAISHTGAQVESTTYLWFFVGIISAITLTATGLRWRKRKTNE